MSTHKTPESAPISVSYRRRGDTGTLKLCGIADIFEAESVHAAALRALNDEKAASVLVNLEQVERMDVAILQILLSLRHSLDASQRTLTLTAKPDRVANILTELALTL